MDPLYYVAIGIGVIFVVSLIIALIPHKEKKMTLKEWNKIREERQETDLKAKDCFKKICVLIDQASNVQFLVVRNKKYQVSENEIKGIIKILEKKYSFLEFETIPNDGNVTIKWKVKEEESTK